MPIQTLHGLILFFFKENFLLVHMLNLTWARSMWATRFINAKLQPLTQLDSVLSVLFSHKRRGYAVFNSYIVLQFQEILTGLLKGDLSFPLDLVGKLDLS